MNSSDPSKFACAAASYKPFISLSNVTGVTQMNDTLAGVGKHPLPRPPGSSLNVVLVVPIGSFLPVTTPGRSRSKSVCPRKPGPSSGSASGTARMIRPTTPTGSWDHPPMVSPSKPSSTTSHHFRVDTLPERCTMCENDSRGCQFPQEDVSTEGLRLGGTESGRCWVFGRRFDCHGRWDCVRYFEGRKKGVDQGASSNASSGGSVVRACKCCILTRAIDPPLLTGPRR